MKQSAAILLLLFLGPSFARNVSSTDLRQLTSETNFGTLRQMFLGQEIIVLGSVLDLGRRSVLSEWAPAGRKGTGQYIALASDELAASYYGKAAKVVALQLHGLCRRPFQLNASGEPIPDDEVVNPYFDMIVQFDDRTLALWTGYPLTICKNVQLTRKRTKG